MKQLRDPDSDMSERGQTAYYLVLGVLFMALVALGTGIALDLFAFIG